MQQRLAQKEKAAKEENLRLLAQRAREERTGLAPTAGASGSDAAAPPAAKGVDLGGYGSDSDDESASSAGGSRRSARSRSPASSDGGADEDDEDDEAAREREKIRNEKRKEREREMRLNNMGSEQRAKMLMK